MFRQIIHSGNVVHDDIDRIIAGNAMADHGNTCGIATGDQIIHNPRKIAKIGDDDGPVKIVHIRQTKNLKFSGPFSFRLTVVGITKE